MLDSNCKDLCIESSAWLGGEASPPSAGLHLCRRPTRNTDDRGSKIQCKIQCSKKSQNCAQTAPKGNPKWSQNRFKIDPESTQNRLKMALKTQAHKQLEKRGGNLDFGSPPETPGAPKIHEKTYQKNDQKKVPSKNDIFCNLCVFRAFQRPFSLIFGSKMDARTIIF